MGLNRKNKRYSRSDCSSHSSQMFLASSERSRSSMASALTRRLEQLETQFAPALPELDDIDFNQPSRPLRDSRLNHESFDDSDSDVHHTFGTLASLDSEELPFAQ